MGSAPDYDPNVYTPPVSTSAIKTLTARRPATPLFNRAIQSGYPTGSTFKLITGTAALEEGSDTPEEIVDDPGCYRINVGDPAVLQRRQCGQRPHQHDRRPPRLLRRLLLQAGHRARERQRRGPAEVGRQLRLRQPHRDRPAGRERRPRCRRRSGATTSTSKATEPDSACGDQASRPGPDCCETDRQWSVGDNINLAVGQGDLQRDAAAAGGRLRGDRQRRRRRPPAPRPMHAEDADGRAHAGDRARRRSARSTSTPTCATTIMEGLREAAMEPGGTSYPVFGGFPIDVAGKTGTAEKRTRTRPTRPGTRSLAPVDNPKYVVVIDDRGRRLRRRRPPRRPPVTILRTRSSTSTGQVARRNGGDRRWLPRLEPTPCRRCPATDRSTSAAPGFAERTRLPAHRPGRRRRRRSA